MKATGIVRHIDDLGRIVIPKEIRRVMRIRRGDPIEIFTDNNNVIFKKYSMVDSLRTLADEFVEILSNITGQIVAIGDRDTILSITHKYNEEYKNQRISTDIDSLLDSRKPMVKNAGTDEMAAILVDDAPVIYSSQIIVPIISNTNIMGSVIIFSKDENVSMGETEKMSALIIAKYIGLQMED